MRVSALRGTPAWKQLPFEKEGDLGWVVSLIRCEIIFIILLKLLYAYVYILAKSELTTKHGLLLKEVPSRGFPQPGVGCNQTPLRSLAVVGPHPNAGHTQQLSDLSPSRRSRWDDAGDCCCS